MVENKKGKWISFLWIREVLFLEGGIVFLEERDLRQGGLFLWQGDFFSFGAEIHIQKAIFFREDEHTQFFLGEQ